MAEPMTDPACQPSPGNDQRQGQDLCPTLGSSRTRDSRTAVGTTVAREVTAAGEGLRRYRTEIRRESRTVFAAYLQDVAHDLGLPVMCDARTVARWEDGDVRWPHEPYRRLLETATGCELADLGFVPRGAKRPHIKDGSPEPEAPIPAWIPAADWLEVHRRTLLAGAATGLAALAGWTPLGQQHDLALGSLSENLTWSTPRRRPTYGRSLCDIGVPIGACPRPS